MSYTSTERETVIRQDDETKLWTIYTLQPTIITKLLKVGIKPFRIDDDGSHWYKDLKFNQVSFRTGNKREMSEEQKEKAAERMRNLHKNKAIK
ncbi:hypothetical protein ACFQZE_06710 [Paenibacillus sp. GCM10027627]|uniref:hypothetical protein n=1 Tax=unclassified Paenibacillus TaxID=185978 RepID=UPI003624BB69